MDWQEAAYFGNQLGTAEDEANELYSREAPFLTTDLCNTCRTGSLEYEALTSFADADPEGRWAGGHECR